MDDAAEEVALPTDQVDGEPDADGEPEAWRDEDIERLRRMIGGKSGIIDGAVPAIVFVVANSIWSLTIAAVAAGAYGLGTLAYRASKRQPIRHASVGLIGLGISLGIALITRNPSTYFVPGATLGAISGLLFLIGALFKQPVSAMFAMALERKPKEHYQRPEVLRMHILISSIWGLVYLGRAGLRAFLISRNETELLGASAIALGYPLNAALAACSVLYLRRGTRRLEAAESPAP